MFIIQSLIYLLPKFLIFPLSESLQCVSQEKEDKNQGST